MIDALMQMEAMQDEIIIMQQDALNKMFLLLCQYAAVEEMDHVLASLEGIADFKRRQQN